MSDTLEIALQNKVITSFIVLDKFIIFVGDVAGDSIRDIAFGNITWF